MKKQGKPKKTTTATTRKPTPKQERILNAKQDHPELTTREIAAICDTGHSHVIATFQRYMISQIETNDYKSHRADIFAGIQHKILASVSDDDIKKASLFQKAGVVGLLYDKERLERDMSTANIASFTADIAAYKRAKVVDSSGPEDGPTGK